jgi:hypothetical protein
VSKVRDFAKELAQRLEAQRDGKKGAILVTGHPKSGKSKALEEAAGLLNREMLLLRAEVVKIEGGTDVRLVLKDDKGAEVVLDDSNRGLDFVRGRINKGVVVAVELPKNLCFPGATEERTKQLKELLRRFVDGLKSMSVVVPFAIEGNSYTFHFIEERDEGASAKDREGKLRWILKHLNPKIWHGRVVVKSPEDSVEVVYGKDEARALLEKLAKNLKENTKGLVLRSAMANHGLHKGYYFPSLLVKGVEHPETLNEKLIKELEDFEKQLEVDAVRVVLADAAYEGVSQNIAGFAHKAFGIALGIFSYLFNSVLGFGASVGVLFLFGLAGKREDPVKQILEMKKKWEKLPEERKEYLGYQYDAALALPPGTAKSWLNEFFHQNEDEIKRMIGELSKNIKELGGAVRELEEEIAKIAGYSRLVSEHDASKYFGVEWQDSLEPVWTIADKVSKKSVTVDQLVEGLMNDAKSGTGRVYLIRGKAGVGKSALAFYVSCELLSRSDKKGEALQVLAAKDGFRPDAPNKPGTVVFLDDLNLAKYQKVISDVLSGVVELMPDDEEGDSGLSYPMVITVSDERWNGVEATLLRGENPAITSEEHRKKWRKLYREGRVIRQLSVNPLEREEAKKVLKSIMEKGSLSMNYDKQDSDVIDELLKKAGGYPLILKEFIKELRKKGKKKIEMSDVQAIAISGSPRDYMVKMLKEAYFRPLGLLNPVPGQLDSVPYNKRKEACKLLSFLYQLRQRLPAGLLLPGLADATPLGTLVDSARGVLEGLYGDCRPTFGMSLPLCSSFKGELRLSHPLTSDILEDARRIVEGVEEGGDGSISFLRDLRCEGGQFEDVGVENLVKDAINYYMRGMRSTGLDPGDYFYGLFSLLLYSIDESRIIEVLLSQNILKDARSIGKLPEEVRREVLDLLDELLGTIDFIRSEEDLSPDERLQTYYLLLLDNDYGHFARRWLGVIFLIRDGVISREEAVAHNKGFLELLESTDESIKWSAWDQVPDLIRAGVISKEEAVAYKYSFLELLESIDEERKSIAWKCVYRLIIDGVISREEAVAHNKGFLELLEWNKLFASGYFPDLIRAGVISREEAAAHNKGFLELLESTDEWSKFNAWDQVPDLIRAGVISKEEAVDRKESFLELLESYDEVPVYIWECALRLIQAGVISYYVGRGYY